ncbi:AVAST type 4 anti-phage nuclease Avs4 [Cyclobacterium jeungdonense]|uniref:AVAST type 4 anti-phage nuclease Avs4 n=1 Tax=Cyclobacterium jeungdonense TaxID=708087 RepID=A0ABT8CCY1_9BACT|nr:AVAST type 4 anti-phage nuclease Avs4 [Cyclobacterium jeungdonense]MDN3689658.1 AVAST type 4 anti-phage nuclease Avs4 [Cyclobacterium jeungdonense]
MKEINWNIFKAKFNGKETSSFESLAYQLFCSEYDNRTGIFRFKNQTGIETEPIVVDNKKIGFQAKFYDTKVSENKDDIIESLKKAKRENSQLDNILLYLNQEVSESSTKGNKDPKYKSEIEKEAKTLGLSIEWRVPSHFERQLALPQNQYLNDFFFTQENSIVDFLEGLKNHTENLIHPIQTDILYNGHSIKIDRNSEINSLQDWIGDSSAIIVSGEGGTGKTALIKELYHKTNQLLPFYGFKAAEFNLSSIQLLFRNYGDYSLSDFIAAHHEEAEKIVLIDSAEKIADLENQDPFKEFLTELLKNNWTIIFTTRLSYLDDLRFQFISVFRIPFREISIKNVPPQTLELLAAQYSFKLPDNQKLKTLIQNPFYLDEYLRNYPAGGTLPTYLQFKDGIWSRKIQNLSFTKGNVHILREKCFLSVIKDKAEQGVFFVSADGCSNKILALLQKDEIIAFDRNSGGYFITHDIYEEWGQNILIERAYVSSNDYRSFLNEIGNSLSIRRAFRGWLSDKLYDDGDEIKRFIESSFNDAEIEAFWKDEILTSVLLSEYSHEFFTRNNDFILADNHKVLKRIIFLLRISCKEVDNSILGFLGDFEKISHSYVYTRPKGSGWGCIINLIYQRRENFTLDSLHYILPVLQEWCSNNKNGSTTKQAGLLALKYYDELFSTKDLVYNSEAAKKLVKVIISCVFEIKDELSQIYSKVLENGGVERREAYYELCKILVSSELDIIPVIKELPDFVIRFAELFWHEPDKSPYRYDGMGVEKHYSLSSRRDYFPASAYQTPVYWLLTFHYEKAVDFIIDFTNRAVIAYAKSGFDNSIEEVELTIFSEKKKKQYLSHSLWNMYRGSGSPVTPYLLQSIHMALEKILLEKAEKEDSQRTEDKLIYLIKNSSSASISAVVASIVLAHPNKFYNVAKILFSSSTFLLYDRLRSVSGEHQARSVASIGLGLNGRNSRYETERIKTFEQKHRSTSLENLMINYQFFRNEDTSEETAEIRQMELWRLIDELKSKLPEKSKETESDKTIKLLLTTIDRRKMNPILEQKGDKILIDFNPTIEEDLQKHSQQALAQSHEIMKYTPLKLWGMNKFEQRKEYGNYEQYETDPDLVLKETREIVEGFNKSAEPDYFLFNKSTPAYSCAVLIREYSSIITQEDLRFCRDIIIEYATAPFKEGYDYQISDGVEVAVNTIPFLMDLFPDQKEDLALIQLLVLFDTHPLGHNKRICDYSIEAIEKNLWKSSPYNAKQILYAYLKFIPKHNDLVKQLKEVSINEYGWPKLSRPKLIDELLNKHESEIKKCLYSSPKFEELILSVYSLEELEIAFKLIPNDTSDQNLIKLVSGILPIFAKSLLHDDRESEIDYSLRNRVFVKFAFFILNRDSKEVKELVQPFVDEFSCSEHVANFLQELISAEDKLEKYDQFWTVWACFYPQVTNVQNHRGFDLSQVIHSYLLAWNFWKETAKEWHSLKVKEKKFYRDVVNDIGHLPSVFDAIAKFLNEIGSGFLNEGIFWITELVNKNSKNKLERNTTYYVEKLVRRYVYLNRTKVKQGSKIKRKILVILNFLIEKGSVNAYLLREDII